MAHSIWVVDDDALVRVAVVAVLDELGYEARAFATAEALYTDLVAADGPPDLLILDQRLPDENGSAIVRSLRERAHFRDIPVLFLTAISDEEAGRLAAVAPVVRKPFDFGELAAAVAQQVDGDGTSPIVEPRPAGGSLP
ncbi:MAG: response regulator [Candidatus Limnocylindria bacterium]